MRFPVVSSWICGPEILHTMTWLDRWPDADDRTRIVFIAQGTTRAELKEIIELLDRMSARTHKARERGRLTREQAAVYKAES